MCVDISGVVLHAVMAPRLGERDARRLTGVSPEARGLRVYRPFWRFDRGATSRMSPADSALREDIDEVPALAGSERSFATDDEQTDSYLPPNVPLAAVIDDACARPRLVHVPFFTFDTEDGTIAIDGVEGRLTVGTLERADDGEWSTVAFAGLVGLFFSAGLTPGLVMPVMLIALVAVAADRFLRSRRRPASGRSRR